MPPSSPAILRVAIQVPVYRLFDYLAPLDVDLSTLTPGVRLEVPFGKGQKIAYLLEITQQSDIEISKLKTRDTRFRSLFFIISKRFALIKMGE